MRFYVLSNPKDCPIEELRHRLFKILNIEIDHPQGKLLLEDVNGVEYRIDDIEEMHFYKDSISFITGPSAHRYVFSYVEVDINEFNTNFLKGNIVDDKSITKKDTETAVANEDHNQAMRRCLISY